MKRRDFLDKLAKATIAFPTIIPATVLGRNGNIAPSNKISLGMLAVGNHGIMMNLNKFANLNNVNITALCDVNSRQIWKAERLLKSRDKQASFTTGDFREVLARDDIDAVCISSPDHWHVPMAVLSMQAGKDVFSEKPLFCIDEGVVLKNCVKKYGTVFQTGLEDRAATKYQRIYELVRNGAIGDIEKIEAWLPNPPKQIPIKEESVPKELDYNLWVGPAKYRPYQKIGGNWRFVSNFGSGQIPDWATHQCDVLQWIIGKQTIGPVKISAKGEFYKDGLYDTIEDFDITYTYDNGMQMLVKKGGTGIKITGSKGWIHSRTYSSPRIFASSADILDFKVEPNMQKANINPYMEQSDFIDCVISRRKPYYPVEQNDVISTLALSANIAIKLGQELTWDIDKREFVNNDAANKLKQRTLNGEWANLYQNI